MDVDLSVVESLLRDIVQELKAIHEEIDAVKNAVERISPEPRFG